MSQGPHCCFSPEHIKAAAHRNAGLVLLCCCWGGSCDDDVHACGIICALQHLTSARIVMGCCCLGHLAVEKTAQPSVLLLPLLILLLPWLEKVVQLNFIV